MSWSSTFYLSFASRAAAKTALESVLGRTMASSGDLTDGDRRMVLIAPVIEWVTRPTVTMSGGVVTVTDAGSQRAGFIVMVRLWAEWPGYAAAVSAMTPRLVSLATPNNVFLGE